MIEKGKKLVGMCGFCRVFPASRPRLGKGGQVFTPKDQHGPLFAELERLPRMRLDVPMVLDVCIYFKDHFSYATRKRLGDLDNLLKTIMDAMVALEVIADDRFIVAINSQKDVDSDDWLTVSLYEAINVQDEAVPDDGSNKCAL